MKKMCLILSILLILSLAACAGGGQDAGEGEPAAAEETAPEPAPETVQEPADDFVWTREGYFADENLNLVSIFASEDPEYPGWSVGCMVEEWMYGWYIPQEGRTLHGNLVAPYLEEEPFIVTVSEEGEDGILFEIENGGVYHLTPYDMPVAAFSVQVNTEGFGQIAYAEGSGEPVFDDEYPYQSTYIGLEGPETYTFAARPDDGWKFMKWTCNGDDYSTDPQITLEIAEDTELVAVFGIAGTSEEHVELDNVTTLGELLGLPNYGYAMMEDCYIYAFEQDGMIYRAVAAMTPDVFEAAWELEWDDPDYDAKMNELISPLAVTDITNLTESEPSREEMDALVGKTGGELLADGWSCGGWYFDGEDTVFYMDRGPYEYLILFDGEIDTARDFSDEDIEPLLVRSVEYNGIGDPTAPDDTE